MRTKMISPKITTFLESYKTAFERLDADAIADLFVFPLHVMGDDEQRTPVCIGSREEWIGQLRQLLRGYCDMGYASGNILDLSVIKLSPRLLQAAVHWDLRNRAATSLYEFTAVYTLVEIVQSLKITAIAHNELPGLRAYLDGVSMSA